MVESDTRDVSASPTRLLHSTLCMSVLIYTWQAVVFLSESVYM